MSKSQTTEFWPIGTLSADETRNTINLVRHYRQHGDDLRTAVIQAIDARYFCTFEFSTHPMQHRQEYDDLEARMQELDHAN